MSATASLPVCQVIVVLPTSVPPGTGLGSARRTTPITVASFADAGEDDAVESGDGRPQPMTKRPASVRQIAATHEIPVANGCFLSVSMIELNNAPCRGRATSSRYIRYRKRSGGVVLSSGCSGSARAGSVRSVLTRFFDGRLDSRRFIGLKLLSSSTVIRRSRLLPVCRGNKTSCLCLSASDAQPAPARARQTMIKVANKRLFI